MRFLITTIIAVAFWAALLSGCEKKPSAAVKPKETPTAQMVTQGWAADLVRTKVDGVDCVVLVGSSGKGALSCDWDATDGEVPHGN